jgi:hypothetical protein
MLLALGLAIWGGDSSGEVILNFNVMIPLSAEPLLSTVYTVTSKTLIF